MPIRLPVPSPIEDPEFLATTHRHARRVIDGFISFAFQGNVLEIAVGLIAANMFTGLVTSLVSDLLLPMLSILLPPLDKNLEEKFAVLRPGPSHKEGNRYNTIAQARQDGAVVMAYGVFLNQLINFLGVGFALYILASVYQHFTRDPIIKHKTKCKYCRQEISDMAVRCIHCTSWQDGREDVRPLNQ